MYGILFTFFVVKKVKTKQIFPPYYNYALLVGQPLKTTINYIEICSCKEMKY